MNKNVWGVIFMLAKGFYFKKIQHPDLNLLDFMFLIWNKSSKCVSEELFKNM